MWTLAPTRQQRAVTRRARTALPARSWTSRTPSGCRFVEGRVPRITLHALKHLLPALDLRSAL